MERACDASFNLIEARVLQRRQKDAKPLERVSFLTTPIVRIGLCPLKIRQIDIMADSLKPQKRILGDASVSRRNVQVQSTSPTSAKKRKLEAGQPQTNIRAPLLSSQNGLKSSFGSAQRSQQKSQFEDVLEKLTQDIGELKENNAEKDQKWERPPLDGFDPSRDNLCFQQIDVEEGYLAGGTAVKLFGVTEVWFGIISPIPSFPASNLFFILEW